jgi:hypothetical protein
VREEKESGDGGGQRRIPDVNTRRLSGLKYELVCCFELVPDMIVGDEFVNDVDGPAFLERELMTLSGDGYH